ncbi:MAG: hypothetical protein NTV68_08175 [Methanomicrobiales archaeon]|nr:hypothetical protein [Methanomicrobiales archaeon]
MGLVDSTLPGNRHVGITLTMSISQHGNSDHGIIRKDPVCSTRDKKRRYVLKPLRKSGGHPHQHVLKTTNILVSAIPSHYQAISSGGAAPFLISSNCSIGLNFFSIGILDAYRMAIQPEGARDRFCDSPWLKITN